MKPLLRDGPLENLLGGGGGAGEVQKNIFAQGKIKWKKIHTRQLILTHIHATTLKNSYKEVDNEKKIPAAQTFPTPPP